MANVLVQSATTSYASSGAARTLAFPGDVTAGNLLVVALAYYANSGVAANFAVTDSLGQTYSPTTNSPFFWVNQGCALFSFQNTTGGPCTVTITPDEAVYQTITVLEYSGVSTTSAFRADVAGTHSATTTPTTGTVAATAGDLVVIVYGQGDSAIASQTANSPFNLRSSQLNGSSFDGGAVADDLSASGPEAGSFTIAASRNWTAIGAAFKASGGGGSTDWTPVARKGQPAPPQAEPPAPPRTGRAALLPGGGTPGVSDWLPPGTRALPAAERAEAPRRPARPTSPAILVPPTPRPGPGRGRNRPYLPRVPKPPTGNSPGELAEYARRLARHSELISDAFNAWVDAGHVVQFASRDWQIRTGAVQATRDPNVNDDVLAGFPVGCPWVNGTTKHCWVCCDNAAGAAVWRPVT